MSETDVATEQGEKIIADDERQYLTFQLGSEELGINILSIKEITSYTEVTRVPMVANYIVGVMNVRGNVVPVIDLAPRFGKKSGQITDLTCIIIVEILDIAGAGSSDVGVVVDAVEDVISLSDKNMESAPSFGANIRSDYIEGIGKVKNRFIKLLNISNVLDLEDLSQFHMNLEDLHDQYLKRINQMVPDQQTKEAVPEIIEEKIEEGISEQPKQRALEEAQTE